MKTYRTLLLTAVACTAWLTAPMFAQTGAGVRVDIPFAFHLGQQTLPAGSYNLLASSGSAVMLIRNADGQTTWTLAMHNPPPANCSAASVVFRVYGATRFLSAVKIPNATSYSVPKSPAEREFSDWGIPTEVAVLARGR